MKNSSKFVRNTIFVGSFGSVKLGLVFVLTLEREKRHTNGRVGKVESLLGSKFDTKKNVRKHTNAQASPYCEREQFNTGWIVSGDMTGASNHYRGGSTGLRTRREVLVRYLWS